MLCSTQCISVFGDIFVDFVLLYKEKFNKWISLTFYNHIHVELCRKLIGINDFKMLKMLSCFILC